MSRITINPDLCNRCSICVLSCPVPVLVQKDGQSIPQAAHEEMCISCGHCVAICPHGAVSHVDFPEGTASPIKKELIPSYEQVLEMLRSRRSVRVFQDRPVEREMVEKIIDAARFAPSGHNAQSTEFIVVQDRETLNKITQFTAQYLSNAIQLLRRRSSKSTLDAAEQLENVISGVHDGRDPILRGAPLLIIFHGANTAPFSDVNSALALSNAALAIQALGLGCFYVGYVVATCKRDKNIPGLLSVPDDHEVHGALAVGYPRFEDKNWVERKPAKVHWF